GFIIISSILAIFGGALMSLFGFKYNSVSHIILYFIICSVVGFPVEILTKAFPKALTSLGKITTKIEKILFIVLDTIGTGIVMATVDYFMNSVSATDLSILIISFIMAIISLDKN
ncbi:MAG: YrvL family regulatory protein, partial [Sarcina sp.]